MRTANLDLGWRQRIYTSNHWTTSLEGAIGLFFKEHAYYPSNLQWIEPELKRHTGGSASVSALVDLSSSFQGGISYFRQGSKNKDEKKPRPLGATISLWGYFMLWTKGYCGLELQGNQYKFQNIEEDRTSFLNGKTILALVQWGYIY